MDRSLKPLSIRKEKVDKELPEITERIKDLTQRIEQKNQDLLLLVNCLW